MIRRERNCQRSPFLACYLGSYLLLTLYQQKGKPTLLLLTEKTKTIKSPISTFWHITNRCYKRIHHFENFTMMLRPNHFLIATVVTIIIFHTSLEHTITVHGFVSPAPQNALHSKQFTKSSSATTSSTIKRDAFIGWDALDTLYQTSPYYAAFVTCSVKASAADAVAQTKQQSKAEEEPKPELSSLVNKKNNEEEGQHSFDLFRNLAFIFYGGFYQGMGQTFLYTNVYPLLFGPTPTVMSVVGQASFENFILAPFFCLPCGKYI